MAGDWIKFELATLDKPEVCQIADAADIDPDAAIGKLLRVWGWFDQQTETGNAPSVSKKLLDRLVGVTGFCEMMKSVGWMNDDDTAISLPNFDRHNGKTAKNRVLTAKRVANHKAKTNDVTNAAIVSDALPKEEKRREDKDQKPLSPDGNEPAPKKITYTEIQSAYNAICPPTFPACAVMSDKRKRQIKLMGDIVFMDSKPFQQGIEVWRQYFTDCLTNPHWCGQNEKNWRADFDFVTTPKNAIKLMERMN
jgi:hypothetical protein